MKQAFRTETGGRIDRERPVRFSFDGRLFDGRAGDTLASALLANGVQLVGRSFKYHRPRGILSAGSEEPNALVTVDRGPGRITPNLRATQVELYDGLTARSQNRYPSLHFDLAAAADLLSPFLPAGFYYKTFMGPPSLWKRLYEPAIRRAAGLGRAPVDADADRYIHQYAHCDVLIVGGGAAGLAAALGAAATDARVMLCDEQAELGGSLLAEPNVTIDGWSASDWVREVIASLSDSVTFLPRTTAFGWYQDNLIGLTQRVADHFAAPGQGLPRERLWHVRAGRVILATGAIERPLVFPGNDRPGIMLAGAARTYLHRYGVKVGNRVVVTTSDDSAYRTALDLRAAGIDVAAVVDQRTQPGGALIEAVREAGIPLYAGQSISSTEGRRRVHSAKLTDGSTILPCDAILMSGGWTPSVHLYSQSRRPLVFDAASGCYLPAEDSVGACAGVFDLAAALRDGTELGGSEPRDFDLGGIFVVAPPGPPLPATPGAKAFVDFQNDVTAKDLTAAAAEGFSSVEHLKRYTTTGMATDQGKTSNINALTMMAELTGRSPEDVGLTTFRPPFTPVTFGTLAGSYRGVLFAPVRLPPITSTDAVLEDTGSWQRARCYPRRGETIDAAVARECLAVRNDAAMLDASTLGKIEVSGPDAAAFLNRIYTGDYTTLDVGRCRYAVLLGEDGFIRDDGIIARVAADRFHVTTTSGGAAFVLHHMEDYLQTEFSGLKVWLTSVTEQWAVISVQGTRSAEMLAPFVLDIDLAAMPHMSVRDGHIDRTPIRLFRVSFTGETGFEMNLPPDQAQRLWDTLRERGVTPYGTDAMHLLRAEKGYIIVGQETDGTVTPDDAGLGWTIAGSKGDFVGKRSLSLGDLRRTGRKQLVGLLPADPGIVLAEGAQITEPEQSSSVGHVTSAYRSPVSSRGFALALINDGRTRIGSRLQVPAGSRRIDVTVAEPMFYDALGHRLRAKPIIQAAADWWLLPLIVPPAPVARPAAGVRLVALEPSTLLSVRAGPAAATAIGMAIGVLLPTVPCRSVIARERAALWLGPDEWLIHAPDRSDDLAELARQAPSGRAASVVDVSQAFRPLELAGPRAAWCLNAFCALDLDLQVFPVGMCTRTLLGKAQIVLWRIAPEVFHLDVPRSFLPYVWACLEEARLEFVEPDQAAGAGTEPEAR